MVKKFDKHPLSQLLGIRFAKARGVQKTEDIADRIGCATSTYRLAESGSLCLNPALSLNISETLEFDFLPLTVLMVAIHTTIDKDIDKVKRTLSRIGEINSRFGQLMSDLGNEIWITAKPNDFEAVKALIEKNGLDEILYSYLHDPQYGKSESEKRADREDDLIKKLEGIPTLYSDFVESFLQHTEELPVRVKFHDLWKWEAANLDCFKGTYSIFKGHNAITHIENLRHYQFEFLWKNTFNEGAKFIFLKKDTDIFNSKSTKELFKKNLKKVLEELNNKEDHLKRLDEIMEKVHIKVVPENNALALQILEGLNLDTIRPDENKVAPAQIPYEAFWAFVRKGKPSVSFMAFIRLHEDEELRKAGFEHFPEGYSPNIKETTDRIEKFKTLWDSVN